MQSSRFIRLGSLGALALALGACAFHRAVQVNPDVNVNNRWHAMLASPSDLSGVIQVAGAAWMAPGPKTGTTEVSLDIANAAPGGVHPWAVHQGQCGSDQGVFGNTDAYKPFKVGNDGKGSASATVPVEVPTSGGYFVLVHASATNMATVLACGNFAPPTP